MFAALVQVGIVWLASSFVVGIVVGKFLKHSNEAVEHVSAAPTALHVVEPHSAATHTKAG